MFKAKEDAKSVFECFMGEVVYNEKGKIIQKTEYWPKEKNIFRYGYDSKGHLTSVLKNGQLVESYVYNELGQRVYDFEGSEYKYTDEGRLYQAGGLKMYYDKDGQLVDRKQDIRTAQLDEKMRKNPESVPTIQHWGRIKFTFEPSSSKATHKQRTPMREPTLLTSSSKPTKWLKVNQRLIGAVLPNMKRVRYEYDLKPTESSAVAGRGVNETHKRNSLPLVSDVSNERIQDVMPKYIYHDNRLAWECKWRAKDMAPQKLVDKIRNITYTWIYKNNTDYLPIRIFIEGNVIAELGLASGTWGPNKERFLVGFDQVGSLRALINSKGNIVKRIDYDSFGNVLSDSLPKLFIPQGFAGGMTDPYTGLTKFGYRYYDPMVGRFITLDPAKDYRGDGDLYDYCVDDPIGRVDRDGQAFAAIYPAAIGAAHIARVYGPTVARYGRQAWNAAGSMAGRFSDTIAGAADLVEGFFVDGPPPNSRSGYVGATTRKIWDDANDGTLEDNWKNGKEKLDKFFDGNKQKVKDFWDNSNLLVPYSATQGY